MLPIRPETLRGHVDALLLSVLEQGPRHGYAIIECVRDGSGGAFDLPTGTMYPALHRLERAGFIRSEWQAFGGRRRRVYELTTAGRQSLIAERVAWAKFSDALSTLLGRKA
ncbi:helix-turn-helix transcriptional regulator [Pseudarthrobacter sp. NPDC080039]|uniref:PadR family transcriptional regulator n=1 Tax=unclassified Pseudarthrobacter TaxID=2647000 RepID=UPI00344E6673